jgi:hypothetical protein
MTPLLSVCIPTYQRRKQVLRQIGLLALSAGQNPRVEICVSDNSTDPAQQLSPQDLAPFGDAIRYWINGGNLGYAGNLRKLAEEARGDYVWYLSDDDFVYPDAVSTILDVLTRDPRINYLTFDHDTSMNGQVTGRNRWFTPKDEGFYPSGLEFLDRHIASTCFISINLLRRAPLLALLAKRGEVAGNATHENMLLAAALIAEQGNCHCIAKSLLCESSGEKTWSYASECKGLLDATTFYAQVQALLGERPATRQWASTLDATLALNTEFMAFESAYTRPDFDFRPLFRKLRAIPFRDGRLRARLWGMQVFYTIFRKRPILLKRLYMALRRSDHWQSLFNWVREVEDRRQAGHHVSTY